MRAAPVTTPRVRDLPPAIWALTLARAVNRLGAFTLPFLGVVLTAELGASITTAGWLLALFGLATIPSRLVGGALADRIGRTTTICLGLVGCAAAQLWLAASHTLGSAAVAVLVLGLFFELYEPPSQAIIADLTDSHSRPLAFGLLASAMASAGVAAGLLATWLGGINLRWLLVADAASSALPPCGSSSAPVSTSPPAAAPSGQQGPGATDACSSCSQQGPASRSSTSRSRWPCR